MPTVADQIKLLQSYEPSMPCAMHFWQPDDVKAQASQRHNPVELTDEQIAEVLERMHDKVDCEVGMNWDVLDFWIDEISSADREPSHIPKRSIR